MMNTANARRILETALICAAQPLTLRDMRMLFNQEIGENTLRQMLHALQLEWTHRGVELVCVASGWRFQSRAEMREFLDRLYPEKPPRYTRAALETLAIIAYRQPVTRGDMEDIRGVVINAQIIKQLEDRGWIEVIGHRETAGRPALFATTRQFLDDLGLASLDQLPALDSPGTQDPGAEGLGAVMAQALQRVEDAQQGVLLPAEDAVLPDAVAPADAAPEAPLVSPPEPLIDSAAAPNKDLPDELAS